MGIWVGRYAIAHGEVLEHGPWLVERRRVHDDEAVRLLVLAEPVDEGSAEFCHEVADAIASLFRRESLSLTGGLLRALRQAHANLAEWNRRSLREHRVAVGVTCVAIRDGEATVAQVGPGATYVRSGTVVRRLERQAASAQALGGSDPVEPDFSRIPLADSDLLLLTSNVEAAIGVAAIETALGAGAERALAELFLHTRDLDELTAVLIADLPQVPDDAGDNDRPDEGYAAPVLSEAAEATRVESSLDVPPLPRRPVPRVRSPRTAGRRSRLPTTVADWRRAGAVGAVLLLLIAIAWVTLPPLARDDREARFSEVAATAQQHLDGAAQEQDPARARAALTLAQAELAKARALVPPEDPRLADLEHTASEISASLDRVTDVSDLRTVIEFQGQGAPLQGALVAGSGAGANALWIIDRGRGRASVLDPADPGIPREAYRSGERYDGVVARDPLAAAWDQQAGRLLLLDAERTLWAVVEGGPPARLALRGAADLRSIAALAVYGGNLYILDGRGGEVWRYLPGGAGFDSERTGLLGGVAFSDPRGLVVDGDVFVLDGATTRHFRLGSELPALFQGIDHPAAAPAGVVEDVVRGRFYVADPEGRRVVVSDRAGAFLGQLRHQAFFELRGLALSGEGGTMHALTPGGVYAFDPLAIR